MSARAPLARASLTRASITRAFFAVAAAVLAIISTSCGAEDNPPSSSTENTIAEADASLEANATLERVVDGDTIIADVSGTNERVRLIGIDTPESVAENRPDQCFGEEASGYLKSLLPEGTPITLIRDVEARDQYDRLLAYVVRSSDGLFINLELVAAGYAGTLNYPPNDFYADALSRAENEASAAGLGLWGVCGGPDVPLG